MTLVTQGLKYTYDWSDNWGTGGSHKCASAPESQISDYFPFRPTPYKLQATFKQVTEWHEKDIEHYKVKYAHYMCS